MGRTADLVAAIVPSFCDLALTVTVDESPVTVTTLTLGVSSAMDHICSSLLLHAVGPSAKGHLLLYATEEHALDRLAAELTTVAAVRGVAGPELDQHLDTRPDTAADSIADISAMHQALGALLDNGWLPDDGRRELARRAAINSTSLSVEARLVLLDLVNRDVEPDVELDPPA